MKKGVFLFLFLILLSSLVYASQLKVTEEHPFFLDGKWIEASHLKVGDLLTTADGKKARITNIEDITLDEPVLVYNLEDESYHNYVSNGIIVHNSNPAGKIDLVGETDWQSFKNGNGRDLTVKDDPFYKGANLGFFSRLYTKILGAQEAAEFYAREVKNNYINWLDIYSYKNALRSGDQAEINFWISEFSKKYLGKAYTEGRKELTLSDVNPDTFVYRGTAIDSLNENGEVIPSKFDPKLEKTQGNTRAPTSQDYQEMSETLVESPQCSIEQAGTKWRVINSPETTEVFITTSPTLAQGYAYHGYNFRLTRMRGEILPKGENPVLLRTTFRNLFDLVGPDKPIKSIKMSFQAIDDWGLGPVNEFIIELNPGQTLGGWEYFKVD